jgi:hypothetical protein
MSQIKDEWAGWVIPTILYGLALSGLLFQAGAIVSATWPPFHPVSYEVEVKAWKQVQLENGTTVWVPINVTNVVVVVRS